MDCSVIICTRNRAAQLKDTLSSLTTLNVPPGITWELLVVDNGSSDATPDVISSFQETLPIRRLNQPIAGLSNARNAGVDAAQGKYIVWTDDDVRVDPSWLVAFLDAFSRWPEAVVFGGKITLSLVQPTPAWLLESLDRLEWVYSARDYGPDPIPLSVVNYKIPLGACFAIRTTEQRRHRYDPNLGIAPGQNRSCEETTVIEAILEAGYSGWWLPKAEVKHIIPTSRQTLQSIVRAYESAGEGWIHVVRQNSKWRLLGVPADLWLKFPLIYVQFRLAYIIGARTWPHYLGRVAWYHAVFKYCLGKKMTERWLPGCAAMKWAASMNSRMPA